LRKLRYTVAEGIKKRERRRARTMYGWKELDIGTKKRGEGAK
jgi:hypothetical protein